MHSSYLVKRARKNAGLSIRALAELAQVSPNTIHLIEKGTTNPTVEVLEEILGATGSRLTLEAEPDNAINAFGLVQSIREDIATNDTEWIVRKTAEFVSRMDKKTKLEKLRLLIMAPPTTGSIEWDAFVAGIVEWIAHKADLDVSGKWVEEPQYYLDHGWWISELISLRPWSYASTPMSLKIRGIYIAGESLINV